MENTIKKYLVTEDSETFAISLVTDPAIESNFIALSKEKQEPKQVFLSSGEQHIVMGAVLIPNKWIYRYDGQNEFYISFTEQAIKKMAHQYLINDRQHNVTLQHEEDSPLCSVVESWIVEDDINDKSRKFGLDAPIGSWVASLKINNLETWERVKSGELKGFSVESLVNLEEFSNQIKKEDENKMEINENFWQTLRSIIKDALTKEEDVELEKQVEEEVKVEEPKVEELEKQVEEEPKVEEEVKEEDVELEKQVEEEVKEDEVKPSEEVELEKVEEPSEKEIELQKQIDELQANLAKMIEENKNLKEENIKLSAEPSTKPIMAKGEKTNMSAIDVIDAIRDGSYWNK